MLSEHRNIHKQSATSSQLDTALPSLHHYTLPKGINSIMFLHRRFRAHNNFLGTPIYPARVTTAPETFRVCPTSDLSCFFVTQQLA